MLQTKLRINDLAVWYASSCLSGAAVGRLRSWMEMSDGERNFTSGEFMK